MKKYILMLTCMILSETLIGQIAARDENIVYLWPLLKQTTIANGQKIIEHDTTKPDDPKIGGKPVIRLTDITNSTIRLYFPKKPNGTAVIVCPGGGYGILAMDLEGTEICGWLNSMGVTAILLKYRVPASLGKPKYELPLQDAQRALGLVRFNAIKWHIKPDHIGMLGFSAGGHLTAALCNNYYIRNYNLIDAADSTSCKPDFAILIYPAYLKDFKNPEKLASEVQVTSDTPPTIIVQTEDDPIGVENGILYYSQLVNFKIPAEIHVFANGGHGYGIRALKMGIAQYPRLIEKWLLNNRF